MLTWTEAIVAPRRHDYLLVIPVINEGSRIRRQLERIATLGPEIDIAIADGGSTDGSLDLQLLEACGVRALLTKTSGGKLSAQLRMAYQWAMDQGYSGVVTVDGNDKDGMEAIPRFVDCLRSGYDYVQGSRYLPGGRAINTPLDRKIAGRFLHAPLMSFGAKCRLTDTTNGFRGYSRTYLLDERTSPFRQTFDVYNLLFYLTVRAGALGYRVAEIPVVRAYPRSEKVPTKITDLSGRLALLGEALNAATGAYTPTGTPRQHTFPAARGFAVAMFALVTSILAGFTIAMRGHLAFTPDSWTYFELSQSLTGDFYRIGVTRSFSDLSSYSGAFPPLWPALLLAGDRLTGLGAAGGYYLAILSAGLFVAVSEAAGRRVFQTRWIGLAAAMLILSHAGLVGEMLGGRTMPLQLFLYAAILWLLAAPAIRLSHLFAIGACAGLALMNRFDGLPFVLAIGLAVPLVAKRITATLPYAVALVAALLPWIAYSQARFGSWFVTDNVGTALTVDPHAHVTDWWPAPPPTLFNAPGEWFLKVAGNGLRLVPAILDSPGRWELLAWITAAVIVGGLAWLSLLPQREGALEMGGRRHLLYNWVRAHPAFTGFFLALLANLPGYVVTGYLDDRYFAPHLWLAVLTGLGLLGSRLANEEQRDLFGVVCALVFSATTALIFLASLSHSPPALSDWPRDREDTAMQRCLFSGGQNPVLMSADPTYASRVSAVYGWRTVLVPRNFDRLSAQAGAVFVERYHITHVHSRNARGMDLLGSKLPLVRLPNCPALVTGVTKAVQGGGKLR